MNTRPYLLFLFVLSNITVTALPWGSTGWTVVGKMRGGSDHVDGGSEDEYSGEESEPEAPLDWDSEDTLSDVEDLGALDPSVGGAEEDSEAAESEGEELLPQESDDDNLVQSEAYEKNATEPIVDKMISHDNTAVNDEIDRSSTEPEATFDSNIVHEDNVQEDASLVEDDSSFNIDPMDLADAYDDDVESESPNVAQTPSKPAIVDATMRQKLIKDLKYRRREVKFMKPEIAVLVAEKQLPRPVEGIPPHWLVSQPKSGLVRKVLALTLTIVAIALASQKLDALNVNLPELWKRPLPVSSSDPFDIFDLTGETERESAVEEEIKHVNAHVNAVGDVHSHSVKPGQHSVQDDLDTTWLDKLITCIERRVQAFFRMKL